jgi:hypothetical protein
MLHNLNEMVLLGDVMETDLSLPQSETIQQKAITVPGLLVNYILAYTTHVWL